MTAAALSFVLVVEGLTLSAHATERVVPRGPCTSIDWRTGHNHRMELLRCAIRWRAVEGGYDKAHYIAHRESGSYMDPKAYNPSSGACGIFQHLQKYWAGRAKAYLQRSWFPRHWPVSCKNARANMLVTVAMAHRGGWGPWGG